MAKKEKKIKEGSPKYYADLKEKYEKELKTCTDEKKIDWLQKQIEKCTDKIGESYKTDNDLIGNRWKVGGMIAAATIPAIIKFVYVQVRYIRAKNNDPTQYEEDREDPESKRF